MESTIIERELLNIVAVYQMQNMSGGVNQNCLEAHLDNEEWRCFFAPVSTIISPVASFIKCNLVHCRIAIFHMHNSIETRDQNWRLGMRLADYAND